MGLLFTEHARDTKVKKTGSCSQGASVKQGEKHTDPAPTDHAHSRTGPVGCRGGSALLREGCSGTLPQQRGKLKEGRQMGQNGEQ